MVADCSRNRLIPVTAASDLRIYSCPVTLCLCLLLRDQSFNGKWQVPTLQEFLAVAKV